MATATKKRKKAPRKRKQIETIETIKEVQCEFGGLSVGDETCRLSVKFDRSQLSLDSADELFSSRRLNVTLYCGYDDPQQKMLIEDARVKVQAVGDTKSFSVNRKRFGTGLTFQLADVDVAELTHITKKAGMLHIHSAEEIEDDPDDPEEEGEDDEAEEATDE